MKPWETIADNLHDAGWSLGWVAAVDRVGRTIWIVDAHGYGKRFIVRANECFSFRLRRRAFAGRLVRRERLRLTLGVRDGAFAAGKPGDASGEHDAEEHYGCCEAESDTLNEVAVGNRKDRFLRVGVDMFDRPAWPDFGSVGAGIRVPDDHIGDFIALGQFRQRVGEVGAERRR